MAVNQRYDLWVFEIAILSILADEQEDVEIGEDGSKAGESDKKRKRVRFIDYCIVLPTGVDLSKILDGQTKLLWGGKRW